MAFFLSRFGGGDDNDDNDDGDDDDVDDDGDDDDGTKDRGEDTSSEDGSFLDKFRPKRNAPFSGVGIRDIHHDAVDNLDFIKSVCEWDDLDYYGGFARFTDYQDVDCIVTDQSVDRSQLEPPSPENQFVAGMRVEAVDRKFPALACVATIDAVSGDRVLIYFDGWGHEYDYWCRHDSPEIQPAGTCQRICLHLNTPEEEDERSATWFENGETWQAYVKALGVPLAGCELFSSLVRSETNERVLSLSEACLRRFLSSLREDAVQSFHSDPNGFATQLPASIRKLAQSARSCVWCGQPYLTGYKCVDAFTTQETLSDEEIRPLRTATTCSSHCGQALVYRKRSQEGQDLEESNKKLFLYHRYFFIPPPGSDL